MAIDVRIPTILRPYTGGERSVDGNGSTVSAVIEDLEGRFAGIRERLVDEAGGVRRFVNIYVNDEDIRFLKNLETPVKEGDEISIVPAIAGGR